MEYGGRDYGRAERGRVLEYRSGDGYCRHLRRQARRVSTMQTTGTYISAIGHVGLIGWLILGWGLALNRWILKLRRCRLCPAKNTQRLLPHRRRSPAPESRRPLSPLVDEPPAPPEEAPPQVQQPPEPSELPVEEIPPPEPLAPPARLTRWPMSHPRSQRRLKLRILM